MRKITCCASCSARCSACHSTCIEYATQKMIYEWEKERVRNERKVGDQLFSFKRAQIESYFRSHGRVHKVTN